MTRLYNGPWVKRASGPRSNLPARFDCFKRTGGNRQGPTGAQARHP